MKYQATHVLGFPVIRSRSWVYGVRRAVIRKMLAITGQESMVQKARLEHPHPTPRRESYLLAGATNADG